MSCKTEDRREHYPLLYGSTVASNAETAKSPCDPTAPSVGPTTISIGRVHVYNFGSSKNAASTDGQALGTKRSTSSSSGPSCRICHEGDSCDKLVSPCHCSGSVGVVHLDCMEKWLGTANTDTCEICRYKFHIVRSSRSLLEFFCSGSDRRHQKSLIGDVICFLLLTPLVVVSSFLCMEGAVQRVSTDKWEAGCLMGLSIVLLMVYVIWSVLTVRFHYKNWKIWKTLNQNVKVLSYNRTEKKSDQNNNPSGSEPTQNDSVFMGASLVSVASETQIANVLAIPSPSNDDDNNDHKISPLQKETKGQDLNFVDKGQQIDTRL
ncbi:E3 ubiquitin-protein ligase MARCH2-like [Limulus polyphemus]|uniref:E3 ubiquitin-protein ligase MARCH2-like n=1 Tax=Limulus polyphemus TaxID=6850 RepID=A0ABM1BT16_LIMPO|nr:E3 ubiquitin-protein ligase MARCH2-like [Limulus polyphemus]